MPTARRTLHASIRIVYQGCTDGYGEQVSWMPLRDASVIGGTVMDVPTPHPEPPRYVQIADELRQRIRAGAIPAGALLPSEPTLIAEFQVARGTVRQAIALLRAEGVVVTDPGRGTYARPVMPVRRISSERYRRQLDQLDQPQPQPPETPFTADQGITWSDYHLDREFREAPASPEIAALFGLPTGTPVLERHFVFRSMGVAQQMSTSYMPLDLVAGTPITDPEREPWPGGTAAQLWSLGLRVTHVHERVRTRMPTRDETETLGLPGGTPVLIITRRTLVDDRVVEVAHEIVLPGDRTELDYMIDLS